MSGLLAWRARHDVLHGMLLAAARVAPDRDEARFRAVWDRFEAALVLHMAQEERVLLPAFDAVAERAAPNQRPDVVRADHARIRAHLDTIRDTRDPVERAEQLALLRAVLDHHDRREASGMLAILDEVVDADVRAGWLTQFAAEERAQIMCPAGNADPGRTAALELGDNGSLSLWERVGVRDSIGRAPPHDESTEPRTGRPLPRRPPRAGEGAGVPSAERGPSSPGSSGAFPPGSASSPSSSAGPDGQLAEAAALDGDLAAALADLPPLEGPHGARVTAGLRAAVARADAAPDLPSRRDALLDVLDALRRWRAVRETQR